MFQFTTTTVLNSLKDFTTGKDLITNDGEVLRIKRLNPFVIEDIKDQIVYKTEAIEADVDYADLSDVLAELEQDKTYRLKMYIRSVGNADPFYANTLVFKGKPLYVEFVAGASAADTVNAIVTNAKKYMGIVCDTDILSFVADSDMTPLTFDREACKYTDETLVIAAVNEYQRFTEVSIEEWKDCGEIPGHAQCDGFVKSVSLSDAIEVHMGHEGFGTYMHLMKDYRLPTGANLRWQRTMQDEMPAVGSTYNQYTLYYCRKRGVMGLGAVGMLAKSLTCHVFWVNSDIVEDFEALLEGLTLEQTGSNSGVADDTNGEGGEVITDPSEEVQP